MARRSAVFVDLETTIPKDGPMQRDLVIKIDYDPTIGKTVAAREAKRVLRKTLEQYLKPFGVPDVEIDRALVGALSGEFVVPARTVHSVPNLSQVGKYVGATGGRMTKNWSVPIMQNILHKPVYAMTEAEREAKYEADRKHEMNLMRKRWLKERIYLVRPLGVKYTLVYKKHLNKFCAQLTQIDMAPTSKWALQKHWANYQASGVSGKITGYVIEKHHDFDEWPKTLLEDLHAYAHQDWKLLDSRYTLFDPNLIKWPI